MCTFYDVPNGEQQGGYCNSGTLRVEPYLEQQLLACTKELACGAVQGP